MAKVIKIDKDVPLTPKEFGVVYPWATMAVGDSFLMEPDQKGKRRFPPHNLTAQGWEFESRKTSEGLRFWRTA